MQHANLVSFTCLKAFAFEDRSERKDAHDLIYCMQHAPQGMDGVAAAFRRESAGRHGGVVQAALEILRKRFAHEVQTAGYLKDGPVAVAKFELGESKEFAEREARALRQRQVSDLVDRLMVGTR